MERKDLSLMTQEEKKRKSRRCSVSLLQGDEIFFNKLISRDSSMGFSSHIYYRSAEGVPFKWESEPGTPINPQINGSLPPLSPPPGTPHNPFHTKPCTKHTKSLTKSMVWFLKKMGKKSQQSKKSQQIGGHDIVDISRSGRVERFEFWGSDGDSITMPCDSRSSSSSGSGFSFDGCSSPASSRSVRNEAFDWALSCSPWTFTGIVMGMSKRV